MGSPPSPHRYPHATPRRQKKRAPQEASGVATRRGGGPHNPRKRGVELAEEKNRPEDRFSCACSAGAGGSASQGDTELVQTDRQRALLAPLQLLEKTKRAIRYSAAQKLQPRRSASLPKRLKQNRVRAARACAFESLCAIGTLSFCGLCARFARNLPRFPTSAHAAICHGAGDSAASDAS